MSETDYERGLKEGRVNALLEEHTARLNKINGSVERFAASNGELASAIRTMQEDARLDRERVKAAAEALAQETERKRASVEAERITRAEALEVPVRSWGLRANKATVVSVLLGLGLIVDTIVRPHL